MTATYLQMVLALAAIIVLIVLLSLFLKRRHGKASLFDVVAYHAFGPRKGVAALKVGSEILLLGITANDLKLLRTFKDHELGDTPAADIQDKVARLRSIREELNERV